VDVLNGRKVIAHAFLAKDTNGNVQAFVRQPNAKHKKSSKTGKWTQLPIRKLWGPSIPDALANKAVERALVAMIVERFPAILAHEHAWLAKRLSRLPADTSEI
jgi:hypothetical protein